jgi:hypothetical protein
VSDHAAWCAAGGSAVEHDGAKDSRDDIITIVVCPALRGPFRMIGQTEAEE